jgi:hypothetical protein
MTDKLPPTTPSTVELCNHHTEIDRTIDVGYVHVLTDWGPMCRPDCPHPDHLPDWRALADDLYAVLDTIVVRPGWYVRADAVMARYREARQR